MRWVLLALALLSGASFAQEGLGASNGGVTRSNALRIPDYKTTSTQAWFVNGSTGSDSFDCQSASTPCLTIQGAINKIPKLLQYGVTVTVAAGTYGCAYVQGFTCDPGVQQATGGLMIDGSAAFTNSTLATGTATGTFTASSAGSGTTYGTGTDGAQTWTVNDLTGRFVTAGGTTRVISSNTATTITIVGTWTNPGTVAYTIQDPGVIINTACSAPATPLSAASAPSGAALMFSSNDCRQRSSSMVVRGIRTTNSTGGGIQVGDNGSFRLDLSQIRSSGAAVVGVETAPTIQGIGVGSGVTITDSDFLSGSSLGYIRITGVNGLSQFARLLVRAGARGMDVFLGGTASATSAIDFQAQTQYALAVGGIGAGTGVLSVSGAHFTCASGAGTGIIVGGSVATEQAPAAALSVTSGIMSTCGTGVIVNGTSASAELTALTGSAATTGISVLSGGSVSFSRSGITMTGGTNDINIDSGGVTAALGDVAAATCLTGASTTSQVCGR